MRRDAMPTYATNKRARHDYEILDTIEAGLSLLGSEVKAIRDGNMRLAGSFVSIDHGTLFLKNAHIGAYRHTAPMFQHDPLRNRTLLVKRKEIDSLIGKIKEKGLTIIPLSVYTKGRHIKISLGVAKGKKTHDKRRTIKEREQKRDMARILKRT